MTLTLNLNPLLAPQALGVGVAFVFAASVDLWDGIKDTVAKLDEHILGGRCLPGVSRRGGAGQRDEASRRTTPGFVRQFCW